MFPQQIIKNGLGIRAALVLGLMALAVLSVVAMAGPVWAWIDENRNDVSGEVGDVQWEGIAHIGLSTGDFGMFLYTGSTLTQTDSTVHALRAQSRGQEWCGVLLNDTDWDVEWEASNTWMRVVHGLGRHRRALAAMYPGFRTLCRTTLNTGFGYPTEKWTEMRTLLWSGYQRSSREGGR